MNKKPVLRRCISCNQQREKKDLIRIVKPKDEDLQIDLTGKKNGRGAYICNSKECFNKVVKTKKLERTFEIEINEEFLNELKTIIN